MGTGAASCQPYGAYLGVLALRHGVTASRFLKGAVIEILVHNFI
jgi:hypothetical protein